MEAESAPRGVRGAADPPEAWRTPVRVYFQDTDAAGIVYHARYLDYFERARMDWLRAAGVPVTELEAHHRAVFIVRSLCIDYLRPARLDDLLHATVSVAAMRGAQLDLRQTVLRDQEVMARAQVNLACVSASELKPVRIPVALRDRLVATPADPTPESP